MHAETNMILTALHQNISKVVADAAVVGWYADVRPLRGGAGTLDWLLCGALTRLIVNKHVRGTLGETALLTTAGKIPAAKLFLVGLGPRSEATQERLRQAAEATAAALAGAGVAKAAIDLLPDQDHQSDDCRRAVIEGLRSGTHYGATEILLVAPDDATVQRMNRLARA